MTLVLGAVLFVLIVWWAGTALVLVLQHRLPDPQSPLVHLTVVGISVAALAGLVSASGQTHMPAHYLSFVAGVALWGCLELSYYLGLITGIHSRPCPHGVGTWQRFRVALGASIWHELTVLLTGIVLVALLWKTANPTGLYAFMVLWLMRWSAKLNLFFGVPHFATHWFPERLSYLASYIRRAPVTLFFGFSILVSGCALVLLLLATRDTQGSAALAFGLPAVLLFLAIVEHAFMALPIADSRLWNRVFNTSTTSPGTATRAAS